MKKLISLVLVFMLIFGSFADVFAATDTKASVIRLTKKEGTVTVKDASGSKVNVNDGGKILSGYSVATGKDGTAYLNLDDSKVVKLDLNTTVEIKKNKKKIEVYVASGNIFVSVSEKLNSDEELNVKTTNIAVGVRGTMLEIGYFDEGGTMKVSANILDLIGSVSANKERATDYCNVIEGKIEARNEITGQIISGSAGEQILAEDRIEQPQQGSEAFAEETTVELVKKTFTPAQLQPSTLIELKDDARIQELPNAEEYKQAIEEAPQRQEEKKEESESKAEAIEEKTEKQEANNSTVQVFSSQTLSDGEKNPFYAAESEDDSSDSDKQASDEPPVPPVAPVVYSVNLPSDSSLITYTASQSANPQIAPGSVEEGEDFNFTVKFDKKISSLYITYKTEESNGTAYTLYKTSESTDGSGNHIYSFAIPEDKVCEGVSDVTPVTNVTDISNISALFADPGITELIFVSDNKNPTLETSLEVPEGKTLILTYAAPAPATGKVRGKMVLGEDVSNPQTGLDSLTLGQDAAIEVKGSIIINAPFYNNGKVVLNVTDAETNSGLQLGDEGTFYNSGELELANGNVVFNVYSISTATLSVTGQINIIEGYTVEVAADSSACGKMTVGSGAQLVNEGTILVGASFKTVGLTSPEPMRSLLENNGQIVISDKGTITSYGEIYNYSGSTIENFGTFNSPAKEYVKVSAGDPEGAPQYESAIYNMGTIRNAAGGNITFDAYVYNGYASGDGDYETSFKYGIITNDENATLTNNYILESASLGQIEDYAPGAFPFTVRNSGTINNSSHAAIVSSGVITNETGGIINNAGSFCNRRTDFGSGILENYGTLNNNVDPDNKEAINGEWEPGIINHQLIVSSGTINNISGRICNNESFQNYDGGIVNNSSAFENFGEFINDSSAFNNTTGTLLNNASFDNLLGTLTSSGFFENSSDGTVNNTGSIINENNAVYGKGDFKNSGTIINGNEDYAGSIVNSGMFTNSQNIYNYGSISQTGTEFENETGATIYHYNQNGATISGMNSNSKITNNGTITTMDAASDSGITVTIETGDVPPERT